MILVDTNIVSDLMRSQPNPRVSAGINEVDPSDLALSAVTIFELRFGLSLLPTSAERRRLEDLLRRIQAGWFGKVMPLDTHAALLAAEFRVLRRGLGRPVAVPDSLIAGIALGNKAQLATRNTKDFTDAGLDLIDPFESQIP